MTTSIKMHKEEKPKQGKFEHHYVKETDFHERPERKEKSEVIKVRPVDVTPDRTTQRIDRVDGRQQVCKTILQYLPDKRKKSSFFFQF